MNTNPYVVALGIVGLLLTILGTVGTVLATVASYIPAEVSGLAGLALAIGTPALVGAGVLLGVEWRMRQSA